MGTRVIHWENGQLHFEGISIAGSLQDATSVLDAFHIIKLAGNALKELRRGGQQEALGHRGHDGNPLYQIRDLSCLTPQAHPTPTGTTPQKF